MGKKLLVFQRMVWLCFFSVLTVVAGNTILLAVPQAREALYALDDGSGADLRRFVLFAVSYLYWAFTAWFVARLMLGRKFQIDTVGVTPETQAFANHCARIIPRALGLLASVPLALAMFAINIMYGVVLICLAAIYLLFVWQRRHRIPWFKIGPEESKDQPHYRFVPIEDKTSQKARCCLAVLFALPLVVFAAVWFFPVEAGRFIGSSALMLTAGGLWNLAGSMVLRYLPRLFGWPSFNTVPALLLVLFSFLENHPVAPIHKGTSPEDWRASRPSLEQHFDVWMRRHVRGEPIYMCAVSGGASRAAYWSGMTLGRLEDEARRRGKRFAENLFMLSGVSGGSLGAAAFVTTLAAWPGAGKREAILASNEKEANCGELITGLLDNMLGKDLLAPIVGMLLYPDLLQQFIPIFDPIHSTDRSYALEHAWALDWRYIVEHFDGSPTDATAWWESPLTAPYSARPQENLPALLLNTVRLEDGQRMLQSNLAFDLPNAQDLLAPGFETHHLTLAGAVHNSARFPYISPPGSVRVSTVAKPAGKGPVWGHLGDGGYHESSGTASMADVIERLQASGRIRSTDSGLQACMADGSEEPCDSPIVLVVLNNQPAPYGAAWYRNLHGGLRAPDTLRLESSWPVREISAPPQGLVTAWQSNTYRAEWHLARMAGSGLDRYVELRFPLYPGVRPPSMNWHLDEDSRKLLKHAAAPPSCDRLSPANLADQALRVNLERLRTWIARSPL